LAASPDQIAGLLLEEAILALIQVAGFLPVEDLANDASLNPHKPPVTIRGRGTDHQVDVVADPQVGYPFSNPARLLIEAKAYRSRRKVQLPVVRNAVGTLKDASEFWRPPAEGAPGTRRYHYRYAIFATSSFSKGAQEYAFAQDVYLLPLEGSAFFSPVVSAIEGVRNYYSTGTQGGGEVQPVASLREFRQRVRATLRQGLVVEAASELSELAAAVQRVRHGLIAVADRQFPIFLVPREPSVLEELADDESVRFYRDEASWFVRRTGSTENLFSFDLPDELFRLYAQGGSLSAERAVQLKAERLGVLQAILVRNSRVRIVHLRLDADWIATLLTPSREVGRRR